MATPSTLQETQSYYMLPIDYVPRGSVWPILSLSYPSPARFSIPLDQYNDLLVKVLVELILSVYTPISPKQVRKCKNQIY